MFIELECFFFVRFFASGFPIKINVIKVSFSALTLTLICLGNVVLKSLATTTMPFCKKPPFLVYLRPKVLRIVNRGNLPSTFTTTWRHITVPRPLLRHLFITRSQATLPLTNWQQLIYHLTTYQLLACRRRRIIKVRRKRGEVFRRLN